MGREEADVRIEYTQLTSTADRLWREKNVPLCEHGNYFDRCDECGVVQITNAVQ
jgi:hypothetical protein